MRLLDKVTSWDHHSALVFYIVFIFGRFMMIRFLVLLVILTILFYSSWARTFSISGHAFRSNQTHLILKGTLISLITQEKDYTLRLAEVSSAPHEIYTYQAYGLMILLLKNLFLMQIRALLMLTIFIWVSFMLMRLIIRLSI